MPAPARHSGTVLAGSSLPCCSNVSGTSITIQLVAVTSKPAHSAVLYSDSSACVVQHPGMKVSGSGTEKVIHTRLLELQLMQQTTSLPSRLRSAKLPRLANSAALYCAISDQLLNLLLI